MTDWGGLPPVHGPADDPVARALDRLLLLHRERRRRRLGVSARKMRLALSNVGVRVQELADHLDESRTP